MKAAIERDSGCRECSYAKSKLSDPRIRRLNDYKSLAKAQGSTYLKSFIPKRTSESVIDGWSCTTCESPFKQSFTGFKDGRTRCLSCTKKKRTTIEQMHEWATAHGGKCTTAKLSEAGKTIVQFHDENGREFSRKASFVVNGGKWPSQRKKVQKHDGGLLLKLAKELGLIIEEEIANSYSNNTQKFPAICKCCGEDNIEVTIRQISYAVENEKVLCPTCRALGRLD